MSLQSITVAHIYILVPLINSYQTYESNCGSRLALFFVASFLKDFQYTKRNFPRGGKILGMKKRKKKYIHRQFSYFPRLLLSAVSLPPNSYTTEINYRDTISSFIVMRMRLNVPWKMMEKVVPHSRGFLIKLNRGLHWIVDL